MGIVRVQGVHGVQGGVLNRAVVDEERQAEKKTGEQ